MKQYLDLLNRVLTEGIKSDRTGTSTMGSIRTPDAFQYGRGLPLSNYQETSFEIHYPRTALVPERRYKRKIPARERGTHLE